MDRTGVASFLKNGTPVCPKFTMPRLEPWGAASDRTGLLPGSGRCVHQGRRANRHRAAPAAQEPGVPIIVLRGLTVFGSTATSGWYRTSGFESWTSAAAAPPARSLSFEFIRRAENRSDEEAERMTTVRAIPELCNSLALAGELLEMTRGSTKTPLSDWLGRADGSGTRLVQSFAETLRTDSSAVQGALSTRWNNGPVEGHVNRLKLIKRSMYGRAGLPLLRARVRAKVQTRATFGS